MFVFLIIVLKNFFYGQNIAMFLLNILGWYLGKFCFVRFIVSCWLVSVKVFKGIVMFVNIFLGSERNSVYIFVSLGGFRQLFVQWVVLVIVCILRKFLGIIFNGRVFGFIFFVFLFRYFRGVFFFKCVFFKKGVFFFRVVVFFWVIFVFSLYLGRLRVVSFFRRGYWSGFTLSFFFCIS